MKLLLDSHTLIWLYSANPKLSQKAINEIEKTDNQSFFSMASIWEMGIKIKLGKMNLNVSLAQFVEDILNNGISILNIEMKHIFKTQELDFHHRDPFDRLIFAQAISENMMLVSADQAADAYFTTENVKRIW